MQPEEWALPFSWKSTWMPATLGLVGMARYTMSVAEYIEWVLHAVGVATCGGWGSVMEQMQ